MTIGFPVVVSLIGSDKLLCIYGETASFQSLRKTTSIPRYTLNRTEAEKKSG